MNPQQNQYAMLAIFGNQAVVDYLKNLLKLKDNINHNDAELHLAAFNSLSVAQNMNSQIAAIRSQIEEEIKHSNMQTPPIPSTPDTVN